MAHVMISARFDGADHEARVRRVAEMLKQRGTPVYIVEAGIGECFGEMTVLGLAGAFAMAAFCSCDPPYGEKTGSKFCTYYELKFAYEHDLPIFAVQMGETFPPKTPEPAGTAMNAFALTSDLVRVDGRNLGDDALADALHAAAQKLRGKVQGQASSPAAAGVGAPTDASHAGNRVGDQTRDRQCRICRGTEFYDSVPESLVMCKSCDIPMFCLKCGESVDFCGTGSLCGGCGHTEGYWCAAAHFLSSQRIPTFGGASTLWTSAVRVVDFVWGELPGLIQWPLLPRACGPEPWASAALAACIHDDVGVLRDLAKADVHAFEALLAEGAALGRAAQRGNRRAVGWLLEQGAAVADYEPSRGPCEAAAEGLFLPALELLWGRRCEDWGDRDYRSLRLPRQAVVQLRRAAAWYADFEAESAAAAEALCATAVGIRHTTCRCVTPEAIAEAHRGPTCLVPRPEEAKRQFEAGTTVAAPGTPVDAYIVHTSDDSPDFAAKKAARIHSAAAPDETVLFDLLCAPQWDIELKSAYIRAYMSHFMRTAERCVIVFSKTLLTKWWPVEELLTFAKLHGYGSLTLAATTEDIPDGDVEAYVRACLPSTAQELGAKGGMNFSMIELFRCKIVDSCDKERTKIAGMNKRALSSPEVEVMLRSACGLLA